MLRRKIKDQLIAWKSKTNKLPLLIQGARRRGSEICRESQGEVAQFAC